MSERDSNTSNDREFKRSASSAILPFMISAAFTLAGLVGATVLAKLTEVEAAIEQLKIDVAVIKTDINYMKQRQTAERE